MERTDEYLLWLWVKTAHLRSATAKGEIRYLIETTSDRVSADIRLTDRSILTMADITSSVSQLADAMEENTASSKEQTALLVKSV